MKISIVIPTRNGSPFIRSCLQSCLNSSDPNLEIIVNDNNSSDDSAEIAKEFSDTRLHYFNTGKSVSMRKNYELALEKVTGDYVIYIGDDDGIISGNLKLLRRYIEEYQPDAITWKPFDYRWPRTDQYNRSGILNFDARNFNSPPEKKDAQNILRDFCNADLKKYKSGANLYHGCVKKSVIDNVCKKTGVYFQAQNPDVFTSLANLSEVKTFIYMGQPVTIGGESEKSTGLALIGENAQKNSKEIANSFISLANDDDISFEWNHEIRSVVVITYACLNRVNDIFYNGSLKINHPRWRAIMRNEISKLPIKRQLSSPAIMEEFFTQFDPSYDPNETPPIETPETQSYLSRLQSKLSNLLRCGIASPRLVNVQDAAQFLGRNIKFNPGRFPPSKIYVLYKSLQTKFGTRTVKIR